MSSVGKFIGQKPIGPPKPLSRPNARASDSDVRKMTGSSHTPGGQAKVHRTTEGDHRQPHHHTGHANRSTPPQVQAGRPYMGGPDDEAA
jgi:hypothetical protein